jgi:hypothetical protein
MVDASVFEMETNFSPKASAFLLELDDLCKKHRVMISTSGYDSIQFWDLKEGEQTIYCPCIEDKIKNR